MSRTIGGYLGSRGGSLPLGPNDVSVEDEARGVEVGGELAFRGREVHERSLRSTNDRSTPATEAGRNDPLTTTTKSKMR